ncbi:RING-H2 finger protein ATL56 [Lactuca sativa]|uniref:RING-type domain-containing protein n=1 Tax=Lactuca sativa TaxID=4236 RepID=A0A9R1XET2_LACSA|nr:RING-H2 finger protein ATL56 [Lactuca sativa]KAJ0205442.1 hypothetical protein LSAT_V11C500234770 [Lactuca sativa]
MVTEIVTCVILMLVGIAFLVVILVCLVERGSGITQESAERTTLIQRSSSMSEDDIKNLPWYDYQEDVEKGVECAVCLEGFKPGDKCRLLPNCRHTFHANCIDSWLIKTAVCPVCRTCVDTINVQI